MADNRKMSIEDILSACRQTDGGGDDESTTSSSPEAEVAATQTSGPAEPASPSPQPTGDMNVADILAAARAEKAGAAKPAVESTAPKSRAANTEKVAKKADEMGVADILAAARAEKSGGEKSTVTTKKPAPQTSPAKVSKPAAKPAPTTASLPKDTSSILAAARKSDKPGPMSKTEAASRAKPEPKAAKAPKPTVPPMPERPGYAAPQPAVAVSDDGRRTFLAVFMGSFLAVGFSSMAAVFGLWTLGFARFMFPNILTEPPSQFKVGFPSDFALGQVATKFKAQFGVWIVNAEYDGQPQIVALKSVCTHLGCTPNWLEAEQKFKCPCHGSGFYKEGINFEGPAPRPLERYAIRLADDGQLEVDKSRKFQEEMGQWADSASFVAV